MRVRAAVDRWFGPIVVACLLVAGAGAVLAHGAYVDPGSHQEQRVVDEWRANGSFSHGSVVTDAADGTPFTTGETVRNRAVYFQRVMPVLTGEFVFRTPGADAPVNLTVDRRLVVESVETTRSDEDSTVYWRDTRSLGTDRTTKQPGEAATAPFELNVTRTLTRARNVSDRLDSPGQIRTRVLVSVEATRQVSGAETRRLTYELPITGGAGIYRVEAASSTERFTETEVVTVPNEPTGLQRIGGPLLTIGGLLGLIGLAIGRWRGAVGLADDEREWLAYRNDRADFDEWISAIRLPDEARDLPVAEADTLADLVDFAIDTDSAVMEEPDGDAYHVVRDGYRYTYRAPTEPGRTDPLSGSAVHPSQNGSPEHSGDGEPVAPGASDDADE